MLLELPFEILQHLVSRIFDVATLVALGASCRVLRRAVYQRSVWRAAALRAVDGHLVATMLAQHQLARPSSEPGLEWWFGLCLAAGSRRPRLKIAEQLTGRMRASPVGPRLKLARSGHTATPVLESHVLILGGVGGQVMEVIWDPLLVDLATMEVTEPINRAGSGSLVPSPRLRHTACAIDRHRLFVFGGYALDPHSARGDCYICDVAPDAHTLTWTRLQTAGQSPSLRYHHVSGVFGGGRSVVVYGGEQHPGLPPEPADTVYILDLTTLHWSKHSSAGPRPLLALLQMSVVHRRATGDRLVVFGGVVDPDDDAQTGDVMVVHSLDLSTLMWSATLKAEGERAVPRSRTRSAYARLGPDAILVLGGGHSSGAMDFDSLDDAVRLDLTSDSWSS